MAFLRAVSLQIPQLYQVVGQALLIWQIMKPKVSDGDYTISPLPESHKNISAKTVRIGYNLTDFLS